MKTQNYLKENFIEEDFDENLKNLIRNWCYNKNTI